MALCLFALSSCSKNPVEKEVDEFKKQLPMEVEEGLCITDVNYDSSTKELEYTYTVFQEIFDGVKQQPEIMKSLFLPIFKEGMSGNLEEYAKYISNVHLVFTCNGQKTTITLPFKEIVNAEQMSEEVEAEVEDADIYAVDSMGYEAEESHEGDFLAEFLSDFNGQCPMDLGNGNTFDNISLSGNYIVFNITCPDVNDAQCRDVANNMLANMLKQKSTKPLIEYLRNNDMGMKSSVLGNGTSYIAVKNPGTF